MVVELKRVSPQEFEAFIRLPEHENSHYEYIGGEIYEGVSDFFASEVAGFIYYILRTYLLTNPIGRLSLPDGGYLVGDDRYMPDVDFILHERFPQDYNGGYVSVAPDLAVEVVSPTDSARMVSLKTSNYLAAGTIVWVVYPQEQIIHVHVPRESVQVIERSGTINGGDLLPGFSLTVNDIFSQQQ